MYQSSSQNFQNIAVKNKRYMAFYTHPRYFFLKKHPLENAQNTISLTWVTKIKRHSPETHTLLPILFVALLYLWGLIRGLWNTGYWEQIFRVGGAVASWLVRSTPDRAVLVRALAGDIVLCYLARNSTLTAPLSTQERGKFNVLGNPAMD